MDLYRELQAVTPDQCQSMLHDPFEANTFWELATKQAKAVKADAGAWTLPLECHMTAAPLGQLWS
jgi:hypothetical protein